MSLPENPENRLEQYLQNIAEGSGDVPETPSNRLEEYLAYIVEHINGDIPTITIAASQVVSADPMVVQLTDAQAVIMEDSDVSSIKFDATGIGFGIVTMNKAIGDDDPLSYCGATILPYYYATSDSIVSIYSLKAYAYAYSPGDKRVMLVVKDFSVDDGT